MIAFGNNLELPEAFCWTKFGGEAGEPIEAIFYRKEIERSKNGGTFLWGIGQSIRPSLEALLHVTRKPEVLFSPIKASTSARDLFPSKVVIWCDAIGYDGQRYRLPRFSLVTSRLDPSNPRQSHYALVCQRGKPILVSDQIERTVAPANLRNLLSGSALGSSQVTSVVRHVRSTNPITTEYPVITRAQLVYPYLIRLTQGIPVPDSFRLGHTSSQTCTSTVDSLLKLRGNLEACQNLQGCQEPLFSTDLRYLGGVGSRSAGATSLDGGVREVTVC